MALTYPLTLPTTLGYAEMEWIARAVVGVGTSPFTLEADVQALQGQRWEGVWKFPEDMDPATADALIGVLLGLNGPYGTFYGGPKMVTAPRGTWAGVPAVNGTHAARVSSISMKSFTAGATVKAGDWLQIGSGSSSRLHRVVKDATAGGGGTLTLEIWPATRAALADGDTFTTSSPKGVFRLQGNVQWTERDVRMGGLSLPVEEAL